MAKKFVQEETLAGARQHFPLADKTQGLKEVGVGRAFLMAAAKEEAPEDRRFLVGVLLKGVSHELTSRPRPICSNSSGKRRRAGSTALARGWWRRRSRIFLRRSPMVLQGRVEQGSYVFDRFSLIKPMGCSNAFSGSRSENLVIPWIKSHFVTSR